MFGVNSGFWLGFDKLSGHDAVIIGARALGFSFQCRHLNVSVLALECSSAGTLMFQCWHFSVSVLAFECFSAGTLALWAFQVSVQCWHSGTGVSQGLAQESRTIFGLRASERLELWHWSVVGSGTHLVLRGLGRCLNCHLLGLGFSK